MKKMGFEPYLADEVQGPIISTFKAPKDPKWNFNQFYNLLNERNVVIYPGKTTLGDSFRIGHIGHLFPRDIRKLLKLLREVTHLMGLKLAKQ